MSGESKGPVDSLALAQQIDSICDHFEDALLRGAAGTIRDWLPQDGAARSAALLELACIELQHRTKAGERVRAESYFAQYPELAADPSKAVKLIVAEFHARRQREPSLTPDEYRVRFPQLAGHLDWSTIVASTGLPQKPSPERPDAAPAVAAQPAADGAKDARLEAMHPRRADSDRNLLFGILAVQMDCIRRDELITAMNAWVLDKAKPLAQILVEQGALAVGARNKLEAVVELHLEMHGGDPHQSLAAVSSMGSVRQQLQQVADPELHVSLAQVFAARQEEDPLATRPAAAGQPTLPGMRFRILREHAKGGLGTVFLAHDEELHRQVALKEIQKKYADDPESRSRFLLEAEITGGLEHPGIVPVYGLGQYADGRPFYAMRFIKGDSLKDAIERFHRAEKLGRDAGERVLELRKLLGRFLDVCNAVAYAHSRGVLHRDLKPANVMLGRYGETLLVDWGLAKPVERPDSSPDSDERTLRPPSASGSTLTQMGSAVGTPAYMSPEQAAGRLDQLGPASDVYSLGATLYCLLTGRAPVEGADLGAVLEKVRKGDFAPPREIEATVPRALEAICLKAMALKPEDRYGSPRALGEDIEHWLADEPVAAWEEPWGMRSRRWLRRHRMLVTSTMVAVGVALFGVVAALILLAAANDRERVARRDADQRAEDYRQQLYASNVNRALGEWQTNNVSLAERLLDACPEERRGWEWRYTKRLCYQDRVAIYRYFTPGGPWYAHHAHHTIAFSPDSRWVAAMDWDHTLKLWDTATGTRFRALQGETGLVFSLTFSPDGKWLASGNTDHTVRIWNSETGEQVRTLRGHSFLVYCVHFPLDGQRIISAGPVLVDNHDWLTQMEIITWDLTTGRQLSHKVVADANIIWGGVAFSPDGSQFVAAGNPEARDVGPRIVGYLGSALGQGPLLASATLRPGRSSDESTVKLGNTDTGQCIHTSYSEGIFACAFRPDGKMVATAGWQRIWLWDAATGKVIRSLQGHTGPVKSLAFSPDGARLASGSEDDSVRLWDTTTGEELATFRGHTQSIQSVAFSPDGKWIASAGDDCVVKLWDVLRPSGTVTLRGPDGMWPSDVVFSPEGQLLYSFCGLSTKGTPDGIKVWDCRNAKLVMVFPGSEGWLTGMAMSPDGKQIASADKDGTITLWDASRGHRLDRWAARAGPIQSLAFSADGKALAYTSGSHVTLIDPQTRRQIRAFPGSGTALHSLTFSPDNRRIAAAARDQVMVWETATGQILFSFAASTYEERMYYLGPILAFSSDGKLAAADMNRISIRDALTGREILSLPGHSGRVACLAFSPDGKRLASGSTSDNDVKLWDTTTGEEMLALRGHTNSIQSVAFSPDGDCLASSSIDFTVRLWYATLVLPEQVHLREANNWVQARFENVSGVEAKRGLWDPDRLSEPARTLAMQIGQQRAAEIGRIPVYYSRLGNELWRSQWPVNARRRFTDAENRFRKNVSLNPGKASAYGDFAFFLVTCPDPQFRDAAKALTHAQKAVALDPANADFAALLGMAQYRVGQYQEALKSLLPSEKFNAAGFQGAHLAHLAFLAMTYHQLGHKDKAQETLGRLRESMKNTQWARDSEAQALLREAEELLKGFVGRPDK